MFFPVYVSYDALCAYMLWCSFLCIHLMMLFRVSISYDVLSCVYILWCSFWCILLMMLFPVFTYYDALSCVCIFWCSFRCVHLTVLFPVLDGSRFDLGYGARACRMDLTAAFDRPLTLYRCNFAMMRDISRSREGRSARGQKANWRPVLQAVRESALPCVCHSLSYAVV